MVSLVDAFVAQVIAQTSYTDEDVFYLRNRVLALVGESGLDVEAQSLELIALKETLVDVAVANEKIADLLAARDSLGAELMNFITPCPSQVNHAFWKTYAQSPEKAIQDFYELSQRNDYIKLAAIAKNIDFTTPSPYGDMEITINLSKPEKDPKEIAAAKLIKASSYPKCQLCMENEGYQGRLDHPARANHRIIRLDLAGEAWGFQYSPYAYFNEHSIILNTAHVPMVITQTTFAQLLDIVDSLPGYFVGSNADLPIVGGSILTHNHYQAGRYVFPMEKAALLSTFRLAAYPQISVSIVKWSMSVLRLQGKDKKDLVNLAEMIRKAWQDYSDPSVDVLAYTDDTPHHTVTPIARKKGEQYELDLVLRDNHTTAEFPDGVYHPHKDVQHIKKENIGLIEVMGLAILPPRLKDELIEVEKYLLGQPNQIATYHKEWADSLKLMADVNEDNVKAFVQDAVGKVFVRVLEDAGVYKQDEAGQAAFTRFVKHLGLAE